jgi:hypothetical protein
MTARLRLNRLSVHKGKAVVLDESFHSGVNIIHGDNGSGKSTIADFIFFALGGDLKEWREEAGSTQYVLAEVNAGDSILTLKRDVSTTGQQPMEVFFGPYADALQGDLRLWEKFPYKRPDRGYSFTQVLLKAMGLPEAISDGLSNITMHQILRVLYSDQITPVQRIFRVEQFDTWETRQSVGDFLCGIGGYDLYALRLFLREKNNELKDVTARHRSLVTVAASYGDKILAEHINAALSQAQATLKSLHDRVDTLLAGVNAAIASDEARKFEQQKRRQLVDARGEFQQWTDRVSTLEYEIEDAAQFIDHLKESIRDFDEAALTFTTLGRVRFEFCPSCFSAIQHQDDQADQGNRCHLCGTVHEAELEDGKALAVRMDLEMQVRESEELQRRRHEELTAAKQELRRATTQLNTARRDQEFARHSTVTEFESLLSETSRRIGRVEAEIEELHRRQNLADELAALSQQKEVLNSEIQRLSDSIRATEVSQARRKASVYTAISRNTVGILKQDLIDQSDFGEIDHVSFDFADDWIAINDEKRRLRSASGTVVLKNSFLAGLLKSALEDGKFNLPRFILMDNIEDKGMVQERAWNFQKVLVEMSKGAQVDHQIIFTTSKLEPSLDLPELVIGRKLTRDARSLKMSGGS